MQNALGFRKRTTRLVNALYLLELGLEATNQHVQILLWVAALDAILMASNSQSFQNRLFNLLGSGTLLFPSVDALWQPKYKVSDLAADVYELRSNIAHGREIAPKFLKRTGLLDKDDRPIQVVAEDYQYRDVLREGAFFLLLKVLRKIFIHGLDKKIADPKAWRKELEARRQT